VQTPEACTDFALPGCLSNKGYYAGNFGAVQPVLKDVIRSEVALNQMVYSITLSAAPAEPVHAVQEIRLVEGFVFSSKGAPADSLRLSSGIFARTAGDPTLASHNQRTQETYAQPVKTQADIRALPELDKRTLTTYYDGLGRPIQDVRWHGTTADEDIASITQYNNRGRVERAYLPFVPSTQGEGFIENALQQQAAFYSDPADKVADDARPYSEYEFDDTPIGRVVKATAPGTDYQNHGVEGDYAFNTANEVLQWSAEGVVQRYYPANTLVLQVTTDGDGHTVRKYLDNTSRLILTKVEISPGEWAESYNIYDAFGQVAFALQPEGTEAVLSQSPIVGVDLKHADYTGFRFEYRYDAQGRLIEKKAPGEDWLYLVYDAKGRPVLSQNGYERLDQSWTFVKYDEQERAIMGGTYTDAVRLTRQAMQSYVDGLDPASVAAFERPSNSTPHGFTLDQAFPQASMEVLEVRYFDHYDFDQDGAADEQYTTGQVTGAETVSYPYVRNYPVGDKVKVLGTANDWITVVRFVDSYGRTIQTQSNQRVNLTGTTTDTYAYDFEGKLLRSKHEHTAFAATETTEQRWEYYANGNLRAAYQQNQGDAEQQIAEYHYNALGEVVEKNLHHDPGGFLQSVDYRYSIGGQLLHMNNASLTADGVTNDDANDLFGMDYFYTQVDATMGNVPSYNGNVSAISWQVNDSQHSNSPQRARSYRFAYDGMNRLTDATYAALAGGAWTAELDGYTVQNLTYDKNGNLLTLDRNTLSTSGQLQSIDQLNYTYAEGTNQLQNVEDAALVTGGFENGASLPTEYAWNSMGGLAADANKGIVEIRYNHLGKTEQILFADGKSITYTYLANGVKLRTASSDGSQTRVTDYVDGYVYENQVLQYHPMAEGRVRVNADLSRTYEYFLTDHLGNVRVSFEAVNGVAQVVQENHYYPYGLQMEGYIVNTPVPTQANRQLFNAGSEWQDDFGGAYGVYSTFYREYDPALGRMNAVDPLVDRFGGVSPYNYALNNPIRYNDPNGASAVGTLELIQWVIDNSGQYGGMWQPGMPVPMHFSNEGDMIMAMVAYGNQLGLWGQSPDGKLGAFHKFASDNGGYFDASTGILYTQKTVSGPPTSRDPNPTYTVTESKKIAKPNQRFPKRHKGILTIIIREKNKVHKLPLIQGNVKVFAIEDHNGDLTIDSNTGLQSTDTPFEYGGITRLHKGQKKNEFGVTLTVTSIPSMQRFHDNLGNLGDENERSESDVDNLANTISGAVHLIFNPKMNLSIDEIKISNMEPLDKELKLLLIRKMNIEGRTLEPSDLEIVWKFTPIK